MSNLLFTKGYSFHIQQRQALVFSTHLSCTSTLLSLACANRYGPLNERPNFSCSRHLPQTPDRHPQGRRLPGSIILFHVLPLCISNPYLRIPSHGVYQQYACLVVAYVNWVALGGSSSTVSVGYDASLPRLFSLEDVGLQSCQ